MSSLDPRVSVVVPAYDAERFIATAVNSLLAQTLQDWEAILVDDASTDGTRDLLYRLAQTDTRVRVIALETNGGPSRARNAGIEASRGRWVGLLDADDRYEPSRLATLVATAESSGLDLIADSQIWFDAGANADVRTALPVSNDLIDWTLERHLAEDVVDWEEGFPWGMLKCLVRREFLATTGLRYREEVRFAEDSLFYAELLVCGAKAAVLPLPLYVYTMPYGTLSNQQSGQSRTGHRREGGITALDDFQARYRAVLSPKAVKLISRIRSTRRRSQMLHEFRRAKRARSIVRMAACLVQEPSLFQYIFSRLSKGRAADRRAPGVRAR